MILWRPGFCSSSGVEPSALAIVAHFPKNSRELEEVRTLSNIQEYEPCRTHPFQYVRTVFKCAFLIAPTSNNQQYRYLSAHSCTCYTITACQRTHSLKSVGDQVYVPRRRTVPCLLWISCRPSSEILGIYQGLTSFTTYLNIAYRLEHVLSEALW